MAKATKEEVERRINFVYQQLIQQKSHQFILHYAAQKWGCKSRQVKTYISRAGELLAQEAAIARRDSFDEQLAIRRALFSKAYSDKNWRLCLDILKDQCNLMNMYPSRIGELEAVRILVDANVVPVEVLEKISTALGQFQQNAIAAFKFKDKLGEVRINLGRTSVKRVRRVATRKIKTQSQQRQSAAALG